MIAYYTQAHQLDPAWVDGKAQEAAASFCDPVRVIRPHQPIKPAQLRKFYADVKTQERRWIAAGSDDAAFAVVLPMLKLLKAKSEYACNRKVVPPSFCKWLWAHVDSVNTAEDFRAFLLHFEAVVGFSYQWLHD
jgi:CRISPR-associated protein Csm2